MEPRERERHRWATRTGELSGESESITRQAELAGPGFNSTVKTGSPKSFPRIYRKRLTMHEIKRVAEESTSGSEDSQRAHRGDKRAKPSPLSFTSHCLRGSIS